MTHWRFGAEGDVTNGGRQRGFERLRTDDGFKGLPFKSNLPLHLDLFFVSCEDFIFDSCCLIVPSARRRGRLAASSSLPAVLHLAVGEMWLLGVGAAGGGGFHNERHTLEILPPAPWSVWLWRDWAGR